MNVRKSIEQALSDAKESTGKEFEVERITLQCETDIAGNEVVSSMQIELCPQICLSIIGNLTTSQPA